MRDFGERVDWTFLGITLDVAHPQLSTPQPDAPIGDLRDTVDEWERQDTVVGIEEDAPDPALSNEPVGASSLPGTPDEALVDCP